MRVSSVPLSLLSTPSVAALPGEDALRLAERLARRVRESGAQLAGAIAFGSSAMKERVEAGLESASHGTGVPLLWVDTPACGPEPVAGIQALAVAGTEVDFFQSDGETVASRFEIGGTRLCWVAPGLPRDRGASEEEQTTQAFEGLSQALGLAGFGYGDVFRTWCYNDRILDWYGGFNRARTAFYRGIRFRTGSAPASTGIGAANPRGAALTLGALALVPPAGSAGAREVASPLQCPAPAYGSSFSRAMEFTLEGRRHLTVSGTASIEPGGATVWQGDCARQIDLTFRVIAAILESRGMSWADVCRATAYFKHAADAQLLEARPERIHLSDTGCVVVHAPVCRDDLLFELEVDAVADA